MCCRSCSGGTRTCRPTSTVRPDGKISLPLLNDVQAAGLTPEQLQDRLIEESKKYIEDPNVTVVVSRSTAARCSSPGKSGSRVPYPLTGADHGAAADLDRRRSARLREAQEDHDRAHRERQACRASSSTTRKSSNGKKLEQNIELKPGDTVIVP